MLTIRSNSYEGRYLELTVRETAFHPQDNTSTLTWELESTGGLSSRYYIADTTVTIDGQQVYSYDAPYWSDTTASGSYPFPITTGAVSGTVTVAHGSDGEKVAAVTLSTRVYVSMTPQAFSGSLTLTSLAGGTDPGSGAARITAAGSGVLGKTAPVQWDIHSPSHIFQLSYVLSQSGSAVTERNYIYRPAASDGYSVQLPLDYALAQTIPNGISRELEITLRTYRAEPLTQENQVGSASVAAITVTVPEDEATRPQITDAAFCPSPDLLGGAYIQGKTGVQVTDITAQGKYGASIAGWYLRLEGQNYTGPSDPVAQWGQVKAQVCARDSRGFVSEPYDITLEVLPYMAPKLRPVTGAARVTARRCDEAGSPSDQGAFLTLAVRRSYSSLFWQGQEGNFCELSFRYCQDDGLWSGWQTLLSRQDTREEITTGPLLGTLLPDQGVQVQLRAQDALGSEATMALSLTARRIYWHRDGRRGSLGFGEAVQEEDVFLIGREKTLKVLGALYLEGEAARLVLDLAHPVGSILETVSPEDPGLTLGGAWTQVTGSESAIKWRRTQ